MADADAKIGNAPHSAPALATVPPVTASGAPAVHPPPAIIDLAAAAKGFEVKIPDPEDNAHRRARDLYVLAGSFVLILGCLIVMGAVVLFPERFSNDDERKAAFTFISTAGTGLLGFIVGRSTVGGGG